MPKPVTPPPPPAEIKTNEELYLAGLRLEQFHSPALEPQPYYEEALRRDPSDARANTALGILYCKRGLYAEAAEKLQRAVDRVSANYTAPKDGEAYYYLGVAARAMHDDERARAAFGRAAWSFAWRAASHLALAEMAIAGGDADAALAHVNESIAHNAKNPRALDLKALILTWTGHSQQSLDLTEQALAIDPLDPFAWNERALARRDFGQEEQARQELADLGGILRDHAPSYLELACDYTRVEEWDAAIEVLLRHVESAPGPKTSAMVHYTLAFCWEKKNDLAQAGRYYRLGRQAPPDYCFPFQLESAEVLRAAMRYDPSDPRAPYYLGNLLYDVQPAEAIRAWEQSRKLDDGFATVHRNLALAYAQAKHDLPKAVASMKLAIALDPQDARLLVELDELLEAQGAPHRERLASLESHQAVAHQRDDAFLREAKLNVFVGQYDRAIELLTGRHFHIWEGGENNIHDVHVDAHLLRGRKHLAAARLPSAPRLGPEGSSPKSGRAREALADFEAASEYPQRFERGEPYDGGRAPEVYYFIGAAREACGEDAKAAYARAVARERRGTYLAYYQGLAWHKLGQEAKAAELFEDLLQTGKRMLAATPGAGFFEKFGFAQSEAARHADGHYLIALNHLGLGRLAEAKRELETAASLNVNHLGARTELGGLT